MTRVVKAKPLEKLVRNTLPDNHTKESFKCFGPTATADGQFENTKLCDLMCFANSEDKDNNKFFHASVTKSNINGKFYLYTQWGRLGVSSDFQFQECESEEATVKLYCQKCHDKNDKRGELSKNVLGRDILKAKSGKDLYLVRPQTVRKCGLPDAKNISNTEGSATPISREKHTQFDSAALSLLNDLNIGAASYTRSNMVDESLPTKGAIDEVRLLLDEATKILNIKAESPELNEITRLIYSRIPKRVSRGQKISLTPDLVNNWQNDLVAYEAALSTFSPANIKSDYEFSLRTIDLTSCLGVFVKEFFESATNNRHAYINRKLKIKNLWEVSRPTEAFKRELGCISKTDDLFPEFQPKSRQDVDQTALQNYIKSGTFLLTHGTKSICVGGILNDNIRLPKTLSNVQLTGQYYGNGSYWADSRDKSYGYTSAKDSYWLRGQGAVANRGAFMFLADVICGNMELVKGNTSCNEPPNGKHTIFAKAGYSNKGGSKLENNEFVVFNTDRINLRYLLEIE